MAAQSTTGARHEKEQEETKDHICSGGGGTAAADTCDDKNETRKGRRIGGCIETEDIQIRQHKGFPHLHGGIGTHDD